MHVSGKEAEKIMRIALPIGKNILIDGIEWTVEFDAKAAQK